jgi:hypothetical protein
MKFECHQAADHRKVFACVTFSDYLPLTSSDSSRCDRFLRTEICAMMKQKKKTKEESEKKVAITFREIKAEMRAREKNLLK